MKAGELAKHFGISSKTIHWYEAQGLIPMSERTESGYRNFSQHAFDQLSFVRKALAIGFSVRDIKTIIDARSDETMPCHLVLELLDKKIKDTHEQIAKLRDVEAHLKQLKSEWSTKHSLSSREQSSICPLIEKS